MTTSDDEPVYADDAAGTTHGDPLGDGTYDDDAYGAVVADTVEPGARWLPAILASLLAMAAGVALWAFIYQWREREYPGVAVVIALAVGWLMRVVSRRSTMPVRIVAVLLTALGCVAGSVVGHAAYASTQTPESFGTLLGESIENTGNIVTDRPALTYVIFAAALVLAYLSASPQSPKKPKKGAEPAPLADTAYSGDDALDTDVNADLDPIGDDSSDSD